VVVNVTTDVPVPVNVTLGAFVDVPPPVVPNVKVFVTSAAAVNAPSPVQVNPVAVAIDNTRLVAVVVDKIILLEPNAMERVLALLELNKPVDKLNPFRFNAPDVSVVVRVDNSVNVLPSDQLPEAPLNVTAPFKVVPLVVIVLPVVVELNVIAPVLDQTVPASSDILPDTESVGVVPVANVTVPDDTVISKQVNAPVIVTV